MKKGPWLTALVWLVSACASVPAGTSGDRNVIMADEIASVRGQASTAYDIVLKLRAEYLRNRGPTTIMGRSTATPVFSVFRDGSEFGLGPEGLRNIPAPEVFSIRYYDASAATTKYGSRHSGGVIEIITQRPGASSQPASFAPSWVVSAASLRSWPIPGGRQLVLAGRRILLQC